MARMTRGGGVAAPDQALQAKRAILFLQALQRARTAPQGTPISPRTLARLHGGSGLVNGVGLSGMDPAEARQMKDSDAAVLMSGLDALRKKLGSDAAPVYTQPFGPPTPQGHAADAMQAAATDGAAAGPANPADIAAHRQAQLSDLRAVHDLLTGRRRRRGPMLGPGLGAVGPRY